MSYKVEKIGNKNIIVEKDTGMTVFSTESDRQARNMCRSLNLGSGFNGFTPTFFTQTYKKGDSEESPFQ